MEKQYEAVKDFNSPDGQAHRKGEPVTGLSQSDIQKLLADGSIRESRGGQGQQGQGGQDQASR